MPESSSKLRILASTLSLMSLKDIRFWSPTCLADPSNRSLKLRPRRRASFASLGPLALFRRESIITVLLDPSFWIYVCESNVTYLGKLISCVPTGIISIHPQVDSFKSIEKRNKLKRKMICSIRKTNRWDSCLLINSHSIKLPLSNDNDFILFTHCRQPKHPSVSIYYDT